MSEVVEELEPQEARFALSCKWYVNGFPKSGTHYATAMLMPMAKPLPPGQIRQIPWAGTFEYHSWSVVWQNLKKQMYFMAELQPSYHMKSHCGWTQNLEAFQWSAGFCHVFVYRDLRDVAVSVMYHILSDKERHCHPGREQFLALGGKDEILKAAIVGLDQYAGVVERWKYFAPWLNVDWVNKFRFEDARKDPHATAHGLIRYGLYRLGEIFEIRFDDPEADELAALMVESAQNPENSGTFRAGRIGDWRTEFNEEHKELFKQTDKNNWLVRLGYENSPDW